MAYHSPYGEHDTAMAVRHLDAQLADADERSGVRTRAARAEIAKLAKYMDEADAAYLVHALISAFSQSFVLKRSEQGAQALESLLDAVATLEQA